MASIWSYWRDAECVRTHLAPETPPPPPPKRQKNKGENRMEILIDRKKLFIAMARKNMNIPELAEKSTVSVGTIHASLKREIKPQNMKKIADALDVDITEIIAD